MSPALALIALSGTEATGACPCTQNAGANQMSAAPAPYYVPKTSVVLGGMLVAGVVGYLIWTAK